MNYNERLQALAEEMTRCRYIPQYWDDVRQSPNGQAEIEATKYYAHIAVKHMAELAEKIFTGAYTDESLADVLEFEGLIPDIIEPLNQPEQEDWKL